MLRWPGRKTATRRRGAIGKWTRHFSAARLIIFFETSLYRYGCGRPAKKKIFVKVKGP
jgi:hypothetical protein